jgi:hypothetical protein
VLVISYCFPSACFAVCTVIDSESGIVAMHSCSNIDIVGA